MENKLLKLKVAADILSVNVLTLRRWEDKGLIQLVHLPGNDIRVKQSEIDRIIKDYTQEYNEGE